ncbi:mCG1031907, isoform CRA_b [Mus musculus]|nr:mCG1031907, isoform CRA_b [Mus musculus]
MCVCASFMCLVPPEVRRGHIRRKLWKYQVEAGQMAQQITSKNSMYQALVSP